MNVNIILLGGNLLKPNFLNACLPFIATEIEQHAEEAITDYAKRRLLRSQVRFQNTDK